MLDFSGEAIAAGPERAARAFFSLRIVDAFFMRTTHDPVGEHNTLGALFADEAHDFLIHFVIVSYVRAIAEPAFQRNRVLIVTGDNPHGNFRRALVVGAVVRDGRDRITGEAAVGFFRSALVCRSRRVMAWLPFMRTLRW